MGSLINRKKEKAFEIYKQLGDNISEDEFIRLFKELYPCDWNRIKEKYWEEERSVKPGRRHPMPHPDIYMKNMYRNTKQRWDKEIKFNMSSF